MRHLIESRSTARKKEKEKKRKKKEKEREIDTTSHPVLWIGFCGRAGVS
jgi:hypothetical protein